MDQRLEPCPPGRFNSHHGSTACISCPEGFFCPQVYNPASQFQLLGSREPTPCGSPLVYCPARSNSPSVVQLGYYSIGGAADGTTRVAEVIAPLGFFAANALKAACPAGRYGASEGLSSAMCSGLCSEGYYCRPGSTSPQQNPCGSRIMTCPLGSASPTRIRAPLRHESSTTPDQNRPAVYSIDSVGEDGVETEPIRVSEKLCPIGFYCAEGKRFPCPAGRYGDQEGQHSQLCTGPCHAGYYCPEGSMRARQIKCGSGLSEPRSVFCPGGASTPTPAAAGFFTTSGDDLTRTAQQACPAGSFCTNGVALLCSKGRYGAHVQSTNPQCDGPCAAGFYCPELGSTTPTEQRCGAKVHHPASVFCPVGSHAPSSVQLSYRTIRLTAGPYSLNRKAHTTNPLASAGLEDHFNEFGMTGSNSVPLVISSQPGAAASLQAEDLQIAEHTQLQAPNFARAEGLSQLHHHDFFVFENNFVANAFENHTGFSLLAVENGTLELQTHQVKCKLGHYCKEGQMFECPAGRFGGSTQLYNATCSGKCAAGHYCPTSSTSSSENKCGNHAVWCPEGSELPLIVPAGFLGQGSTKETQVALTKCPLGSYCVDGVAILCPAGKFGNASSLVGAACSGQCQAGYFCPPGSVQARPLRCQGPKQFCPAGSGLPQQVSVGFYTIGGRIRPTPAAALASDAQSVCYSTPGPMDVPAGISASALFAGNINATFDPERYCRSAETGDWDERKDQLPCPPGSFCVGGLRYLCPPGRFGSVQQISHPQCSGECDTGFYCPWGSTSHQQSDCGAANRFCPSASGAPQPAKPGFYTNEDTPETQRRSEAVCPKGHYCIGGLRFSCPPGRFGADFGLTSQLCSGLCSPGYYCPDNATTTNKAKQCGNSGVFCPPGSFSPTPVPRGTYSTDGFEQRIGFPENRTRTGWKDCPPGHFCTDGKLFQCPGGFWGNISNEFRPTCSGECSQGHFCPPGSVSGTAFKCGEVFLQRESSTAASGRNKNTGYFVNVFDFAAGGGSTAGGRSGGSLSGATSDWISDLQSELTSIQAFLSGTLPINSVELAKIQSVLSVDAVLKRQEAVIGRLSLLQLDGMLPNVSIPWEAGNRFRFPAVDIKVGQYELYGFRLVNGGSAVFCPVGSSFPHTVDSGYFSEGEADSLNRTQAYQLKCPAGSYCVAGIRYPCTPGRYGEREGLVSRFCTAACPPGFSCPLGSATPQECADGTYSGGGMHVCSECPPDPPELGLREKAIHEHTFGSANPNIDRDLLYRQPRCKTSRLCCGL